MPCNEGGLVELLQQCILSGVFVCSVVSQCAQWCLCVLSIISGERESMACEGKCSVCHTGPFMHIIRVYVCAEILIVACAVKCINT